MAQAQVLGSLLVQLSMDSAQFERQTTRAQSMTAKLAASFNTTQKDFYSASQRMGLSVGQFANKLSDLKAKIDPVSAASASYRKEVGLLQEALKAGVISGKQFGQAMVDAAADMKASIQNIRGIGTEATKTSGAARQMTMQLSQVGQQVMAGTSVVQAFAMQLPDMAVGMGSAGAEASKFATFMGGPWGIALTTGIALLASFIPMLMETTDALKDATDKLKDDAEKTGIADKAKEAFSHTVEGVTQAVQQQRKALDEDTESLKSNAQRTYEAADAKLKLAQETRKATAKTLEELIAQKQLHDEYMRSPNAAKDGITGTAVQSKNIADIAAARKQLAEVNADIVAAQKNLTVAQSKYSVEIGAKQADPIEKIREQYEGPDGLIEQARKRAVAEGKVGTELQKQVTAMKQQEAAKIKAAQDSSKTSTPSAASDNSLGQMVALLKNLGMRVTSTTGGKHVDGSDHYKGNAVDFVPSGGMGQYSKAQMRQLLEDSGVNIRRNAKGTEQFFGPGDKNHSDHFHVAWTGTPKASGKPRKSEAEVSDEYADQLDKLNKDTLALKKKQGETIDEKYQNEIAAIDQELAAYDRNVDLNKDFSDTQKTKLKSAAQANADAKKANALSAKNLAIANQNFETDQRDLQDKIERLQLEEALTTSTAERKKIDLEILALQDKLRESAADQVMANNPIDSVQWRNASSDKQSLQDTAGQRKQVVENQHLTPLQTYSQNLQSSVANINDAMESIQVDAMQGLTDGIAGAIAGTQKLGDVFKNVAQSIIAELIKIQIQKALVGSLSSALGSVFGGSNVLSSANIAGAGTYDFSSVSLAGARASGGPIRAGLPYLVGERGPEIITSGSSGQVIPNHELSSLGGGGGTTVNYYGPGAEEFWGKVNGISSSNANQAVITTKQRDIKRAGRKLGK